MDVLLGGTMLNTHLHILNHGFMFLDRVHLLLHVIKTGILP